MHWRLHGRAFRVKGVQNSAQVTVMWGDEWLRIHMKPEYAKRLAAEKKAGGSGWETIKWKKHLYEIMNIEIARSNYAMLMERTLPPLAAG